MVSLALASRLRGNCQNGFSHIVNRYDVDTGLRVATDQIPGSAEEPKNLIEWRELVDCPCMRIPDREARPENSGAASKLRGPQLSFCVVTCPFPIVMKTLPALQIEFGKQPSSAADDARRR